MRTFIAIELPQNIKDTLASLQAQLKASGADVSWVRRQNIHLTLKFLGERDDKKIKQAAQEMEETAKNHLAFRATLSSIGAFPKIDSARIVWVGIEQGDKETKAIAAELEDRIARLGIPKEERPFSSHITIGRTKSGLNLEKLTDALKKLQEDFPAKGEEFQVGSLTLFKSTLTPQGPVYEALKIANLKNT
jgi:2'-5' RNA ligase